MKQFIIIAVSLPVMLLFIAQFSLEQMNSSRISLLTEMVSAAKEEAKEEGCFSQDITDRLRNNICKALNISADSVLIEADTTVKYRVMEASAYNAEAFKRGLIHYKVRVPIGKIMAGAAFLGIKDSDNIYYFHIDSYTASERLP